MVYDSAMGYQIKPQLADNQVAAFSFAPNLHQTPSVSSFVVLLHCNAFRP